MKLSCREIAEAAGGTLLKGDPETRVNGVSIDSRDIKPGNLFVPLKGERTDGHKFIAEAVKKGAVGSFCAEPLPPESLPGVVIKVEDTLDALQKMAGYNRKKYAPDVIGITGSSGKTTTKDLIATVLGRHYKILKTEGNYNNEIGLPLTLLNITEEHRIAVLELAMSGLGEIALLSQIARPGWAVITNIGEAHIELLGSIDNIARAKGELLESMDKEGVAVLNGDDARLRVMAGRFPGRVYYYGWEADADFRAGEYSFTNEGSEFTVYFPDGQEHVYRIPVPGKHNISNALAALALGYLFGIRADDLEFGLWERNDSGGRMQLKTLDSGLKIFDDTYNANPGSMKASLDVVKNIKTPGVKIAVLGDMLELGEFSENAHREIGKKVAESGIDYLITVGGQAKYIGREAVDKKLKVFICSNNDEAWSCLQDIYLPENSYILLKGSRGMKLEEIVNRLENK